jgi:hypothetical protein
MVKKGAGPPLPIHEGQPAIWHLSNVLSWFSDSNTREFDEVLFEVSHVNMQCNLVKEAAGLGHGMSNRFKGAGGLGDRFALTLLLSRPSLLNQTLRAQVLIIGSGIVDDLLRRHLNNTCRQC